MCDVSMRKLATGGSSGTAVYSEVPSGTVDGSNTGFTLAHTPTGTSLMLYLNGARQKATDDYSIVGTTITFVTAPLTGSNIVADYVY